RGSRDRGFRDGDRTAAGTLGHMAPVSPGPQTGAGLLVDCLAAEGCEYVFSVPGEETMAILDALSRQAAIRHITPRHDQGAALLADVHGRLTGRCAVGMATLGPGAPSPRPGRPEA